MKLPYNVLNIMCIRYSKLYITFQIPVNFRRTSIAHIQLRALGRFTQPVINLFFHFTCNALRSIHNSLSE